MKYAALVTRMYHELDESLQIIVNSEESPQDFKTKLLDAFTVADYRANVQMLRLFDDTTLTDELNYEELQAARSMAHLLYPATTLPSKLDFGEGEKKGIEFAKNLAGGEVLKIFLTDYESYEDITTSIKAIYDIIDSRLIKTNQREEKATSFFRSLNFTIKHKVSRIIDILYGRSLRETVTKELRDLRIQEAEPQAQIDLANITEDLRRAR